MSALRVSRRAAFVRTFLAFSQSPAPIARLPAAKSGSSAAQSGVSTIAAMVEQIGHASAGLVTLDTEDCRLRRVRCLPTASPLLIGPNGDVGTSRLEEQLSRKTTRSHAYSKEACMGWTAAIFGPNRRRNVRRASIA